MSAQPDSDGADLVVREQNGGVCFDVKVAPRAARAAVGGVHAGALKASLTAPPVDGAANDALITFLADALALPRRNLSIVSGEKSRDKRVRIEGIDEPAARTRLLG